MSAALLKIHHLNGKYSVVILVDDLTSDQAEHIESLWIAQESETLVNWINYNRETDFEAIERYHNLRNSNRQLIALAREQEKLNSDCHHRTTSQPFFSV